MEGLTIKNLKKVFDGKAAIDDVSFEIKKGEFFTFLGPSGCGKTTLLRSIAGFNKPDEGAIYIGDKEITNIPAEKREVGLVFQNYALFPHMNVFDNIAYGLKVKKLSKSDINKKVTDVLKLIRLEGYEKRKITELSGGEQQRVALARALVIEPEVLLLDEPLCNLDAKLRDEMRFEIKELQRKLKITTIFVTHDQSEALTMSQRIAVFRSGKCVQIGTPQEIYANPKNRFVADFIGVTNLFEIKNINSNSEYDEIEIEGNIKLNINKSDVAKYISIRPEHIVIYEENNGNENTIEGEIKEVHFNGNISDYVIDIGGNTIKASRINSFTGAIFEKGSKVFLEIPRNAIKILRE